MTHLGGRARPLSRRGLLRAGGAALLTPLLAPLVATGCREGDGPAGTASGSSVPAGDAAAGRRLLDAAAADEAALLAAYDDVLARWPRLAGTLRPLRDDHLTHRRALAAAGATLHAPGPVQATGRTAAGAVRALAAAERRAAAARAAACVTAPAGPAALLGSIAGSEAGHGVVLGAARRGGRGRA